MHKMLPRKREQYRYWPHHKRHNYKLILVLLVVLVAIEYTFLFQNYRLYTIESNLRSDIEALQDGLKEQEKRHEQEIKVLNQVIDEKNSQIESKLNIVEVGVAENLDEFNERIGEFEKTTDEKTQSITEQVSIIAKNNPDFAVLSEEAIKGVVQVETNLEEGSGFVHEKGKVITNEHVIANADWIKIHDYNGRTYSVDVEKSDVDKDLAILDIRGLSNINVLEIESENFAMIGDKVIALGHPAGLEFSITQGLIAAVERENIMEIPVLQVDMSINPGNSGGPLINSEGKVIGIVTLKATGYEGLSFAISSKEIVEFIE